MMYSVPFRVMTSPVEDFSQAVKSASPLIVTCLALMYYATPTRILHANNGVVVHVIHNVLIKRVFDQYHAELMYLDGFQAGRPFRQCFTTDSELTEEKGFAPGYVLDEMGFLEDGRCWDTNPDLQGYWFNRKNPDGSYVRYEQ